MIRAERGTAQVWWRRAWFVLMLVSASFWLVPAWAQSTIVTIESPRDGSTVTSTTWELPHGSVASASGVSGVQVLLQRAAGDGWLSWDGNRWVSKTLHLPAELNGARAWQWSDAVELPVGDNLLDGNYRLQALAFGTGGIILSRGRSEFVVRRVSAVSRVAAANSVISWGGQGLGQLGDGVSVAGYSPFVSPRLASKLAGMSFTKVLAGTAMGIGLTTGGRVYTWGYNAMGTLGREGDPVLPEMVNGAMAGKTIVNIAVGFYYCMALSSEGRVYAWGYNQVGQIGDNSRESRPLPVDVSAFGALRGKRIVAIAATKTTSGGATSYALDSDGMLYAWGLGGDTWSLGVSNTALNESLVPIAVNMSRLVGKRVVAITAGYRTAMVLTSDGMLFGWGNNGNGEIDYTGESRVAIPTPVNMSGALSGKPVAQVDMGNNHVIALTTDGLLVSWGGDSGGELGDGAANSSKVAPVRVSTSGALNGKRIAFISAGDNHSYVIATDGTLFGWGYNYNGTLGRTGLPNVFAPMAINFGALSGQPVKFVNGGDYHAFAITGLPAGGTTPTPTPTPTPGTTRPANDARASGFAISGSGSAKGTNVNATGDFPGSTSTAPNVWWTYTVAQAGSVTFSTTGSGFDSYLNIYDATGRLLGWNDNGAGNNAASLRLNVVAGQKLYVSVSGARAAVGPIVLSWNFVVARPARLGVARYAPVAVPNGSIINYTIVVMNSGDLPLNNVSVAQNINTDKTVLIGGSTTVPSASEVNAYGVIWRLGTFAPHSSRTLRLQVRARDNNPFGSNIALGNLSVTSSAGNISRTRRMVNIESSLFLIGNVVNALRSIGDAIGGAFSYAFSASVRDQRAKADLGTVRSSSHLLETAGLDVLQLNRSGVVIIPIGGGQVVAAGGANVVAAGGANVVAAGGANVIAAGGANVIAAGGANVQTILSNLISNPASVIAAGGANVVAPGGANVIAAGGGNIFAPGSNVSALTGARLIDNATGAISATALRSLPGGVGVIAAGGANVNPPLNGAGVIAPGGANVIAAGGGNVIAAGGANVIAAGGANAVAAGGLN